MGTQIGVLDKIINEDKDSEWGDGTVWGIKKGEGNEGTKCSP